MTTAVLLMAHGTPSSLDEMPEYLRLVRGGRPPSDELIEEMTHNYAAIGGRSPLTELTLAQGEALAARLGRSDGAQTTVPVAVGMRNWRPFIKDALGRLVAAGATRIIGIPMAPQFSTLSVVKYFDAARQALAEAGGNGGADVADIADIAFEGVQSFHDHPRLLDAFAERVRDAAPRPDEDVVFTAHSLPARVIAGGDRYADEVAATARGVAERCGIAGWQLAYQSAGRTPEPWIGPDLSDLIAERAAAGVRAFLVVPVGFVCDHTEILFDIDVQAKAAAERAGATLRRTMSLNSLPAFIDVLEDLVRQRL